MSTVLHLLGVFLLFSGLGGLCLQTGTSEGDRGRKLASVAHGIGLIVVLLSGLGSVAAAGLGGSLPLWVWLKILIWLTLGGSVVLVRRAPQLRVLLFFALPVLGALAAWLALTRPGG